MADGAPPEGSRTVPRCPLCGKPRDERFRPFCSARCRDADFLRWLDGKYAIPAADGGAAADDAEGDDER